MKSNKKYCHHIDMKKLSLSSWCPWQTSAQPSKYTGHSIRTTKYCNMMESFEKFRSSTEVEEYEKWLSSKFKKSDIQNRKNTSPKEKGKNSEKAKSKQLTGKDFRKNLNNLKKQSLSDDSDFDDFLGQDENTKVDEKQRPSDNDIDESFKPCSLEQLLEKEEEKLSAKRKKRVQLTKLPKAPKIDLDLSDIEDNQIGFCSQVTMDTLFNRCQKKRKLAALDELVEEDGDDEENEREEKDGVKQPPVKKIRCDLLDDLESENENIASDNEFIQEQGDKDGAEENTNSENEMPEEDRIKDQHNISGTQAFSGMFPLSTPTKLKQIDKPSRKKHPVPILHDAVPEAPLDADFEPFLNESGTVKTVSSNPKNEQEAITDVPSADEFDFDEDEFGDYFKEKEKDEQKEKEKDDKKENESITNFDLMGDSLLNLLDGNDDIEEYKNDSDSSPPIISQCRTSKNYSSVYKGEKNFEVSTKKQTHNSKVDLEIPNTNIDDNDDPLFVKPDLKLARNNNLIIEHTKMTANCDVLAEKCTDMSGMLNSFHAICFFPGKI